MFVRASETVSWLEPLNGEPARLHAAGTCMQARRPSACEVERHLIDLARE